MKSKRASAWFLCMVLTVATSATAQEAEAPKPDPNRYKHDYDMGADWFWPAIEDWKRELFHLVGKPNLSYLEIGPFEGRSFFWVMDNILTHPTTKATAIDVFETGTSKYYISDFERRFRKNAKISGRNDDITIIKGYSQIELRSLELDSFDLIYIDGSHATGDVLADLVLSWGLLKQGGIMIMDDFGWHAEWHFDLRPAFAINAFISANNNEIEILHKERGSNQVFLRKKPNLCLQVHYEGCSTLGGYLYDWREPRALYRASDMQRVELSAQEKKVVESILRTRKMGRIEFAIDDQLRRRKDFQALNRKLGLGL